MVSPFSLPERGRIAAVVSLVGSLFGGTSCLPPSCPVFAGNSTPVQGSKTEVSRKINSKSGRIFSWQRAFLYRERRLVSV